MTGPDSNAAPPAVHPAMIATLQRLAVSTLHLDLEPDAIAPEAPFLGGPLGLDSVDAAAFLVAIEKHFDICFSVAELTQSPLASLSGLANLLAQRGIGEDDHG